MTPQPSNPELSSLVRGVPPAMAARIATLGKVLDPALVEVTLSLYAALHATLPTPAIEVLTDLAYGPDPRHRLDLHLPETRPSAAMPTVIFFHGGGFVGGDKNLAGRLMYGNVASFFARHGIIGINATYRPAPGGTWPSGAEDVGNALAWARAHVGARGGDPDRIVLMGQSAGATHVATYAFRRALHPPEGPGIAGVILMSGPYALSAGRVSENASAYFGTDASRYGHRQVLGNIERQDFPVHLSMAEFDPPQFERSALELMLELSRDARHPRRFSQYLGHNHVSPTFSFGTSDQTVSGDILDFVHSTALSRQTPKAPG